MMNKILFFLFLCVYTGFSQTLVVGNTSDSLYVKQENQIAQHLAFRATRADLWEANEYLNDRVKYELHLGTGIRDIRKFFKMGFMGIKMNLGEGKVSYEKAIRPLLERAKLNIAEYDFASEEELLKRLNDLEKQLNNYENRPWYSNFGLGILFPLISEREIIRYEREIEIDEDYSTGELDTNTISHTTTVTDAYTHSYYYLFSKTSFVIFYDANDLFTVHSGINYDREFTFGISIDLSTPISRLGNSFMKALNSKSGSMVRSYTHSQRLPNGYY